MGYGNSQGSGRVITQPPPPVVPRSPMSPIGVFSPYQVTPRLPPPPGVVDPVQNVTPRNP